MAAKKVPSSFHRIITESKDVPLFLRKASSLSPKQWKEIKEIIGETVEDESN